MCLRLAVPLTVVCGLVATGLAAGQPIARTATESANLRLIGAPPAWAKTRDCSGAVIAVVDSGVDASNPHLAGALLPGWSVLSGSASATDAVGHGTKVAGVIGGGGGLPGICSGARILPVGVWSATAQPTPRSIAAGIEWAAAHGATVINVSIAGSRPSPLLARAVRRALAADIVVVAAAGNSGSDAPQYPAAYPGVLAVSGTGTTGELAAFSSFGDWIGIAAPALRVLTTVPGGGTVRCSGTSFAAPIVAGAAALVRTEHPRWTAAQVVRRLQQTADDAGPVGVDPAFGHGILDLAAAVGAGGAARPAAVGNPNGLPSTASLLPFSAPRRAVLAPEGAVDWYAVSTRAPLDLAIDVTAPAGNLMHHVSPIVDVYAPGLRRLAHGDVRWDGTENGLELMVPAVTPGRYSISVTSAFGSRGAYRIAVRRAPFQDWAAPSDLYTGAVGSAVAVGDVTGDGRPDILEATNALRLGPLAGQVLLFAQRADGTLAPPVALPRAGRFCCGDVAVGARSLAVAATLGPDGVETFARRGGRLVGPTVIPTATYAQAVAIGDVNGDGSPDLVVGEADGLHILRHTGSGFQDDRIDRLPSTRVRVADLNGDGRRDVIASGGQGGAVRVYLQDSHGRLVGVPVGRLHSPLLTAADAVVPPGVVVGVGPNTRATGDVDGDGRPDVVWAGLYGLVVVRQNPAWSEPGVWIAGTGPAAIHFARPIDPRTLTGRTVTALDDHGNPIAVRFAFDAATDTLALRPSPGARQIHLAGIRDRAGNAMPAASTAL